MTATGDSATAPRARTGRMCVMRLRAGCASLAGFSVIAVPAGEELVIAMPFEPVG